MGLRRTPLKRTKPIARKSRMRRTSKKGDARRLIRADLVRYVLETRPKCEWPGCIAKAVDVHEVHTRGRGGSELDINNVRAICRAHHSFAHEHPTWAEVAGFLSSGSTPSRSRDITGLHESVRSWMRFDELAWFAAPTVAKVAAHFGPDVYAILGDLVDKGLLERRGSGLVCCGAMPQRFDVSDTMEVTHE